MTMSRRWIPALVAPAVVVAGVVTVPLAADADPGLPDKSAAEVLQLVAGSSEDSFSGTVEQTSALGLPQLPEGMGGGEGDLVELLTQDHTARVFVDGADRSRLQVLDLLGERDVIRNGADVWVYSSDDHSAVHTTLPSDRADADGDEGPAGTPAELAEELLAAVDPSTEVSVSDTATVAGRGVYQLRLDPRTDGTLVDFATIAVDAESGLPLAVQVHARGQQEAAFSVAFTDIDLDTPDASLFAFTPPPGAEVSEKPVPDAPRGPDDDETYDGPRPVVQGEGWDSVVELSVGDLPTGDAGGAGEDGGDQDAEGAGMLEQLTVPVEGGRALQTALVSVLLTDDGRVLAGAVPVQTLVDAAR